jgi:hypothetical protein
MQQSKPMDHVLRGLCTAIVFVGLGFLDYPNSLWGYLLRFVSSGLPKPTVFELAIPLVAFGLASWILGAAVETGLVSLGFRLSDPLSEEQANYDDRQREPPGSSGP